MRFGVIIFVALFFKISFVIIKTIFFYDPLCDDT